MVQKLALTSPLSTYCGTFGYAGATWRHALSILLWYAISPNLRNVCVYIYRMFCAVLQSAYRYWRVDFVVLTEALFTLMHTKYMNNRAWYTYIKIYAYTHPQWKPLHPLTSWSGYWLASVNLLAALAKLRKATVSFIMFVGSSVCLYSSPTRRIFMKFCIWMFFENVSRKLQFH